MAPSVESLRNLVDQMRAGDPLARQRFRQELEPGLEHLMRRSLRTRTGKLARWMSRAGVSGDQIDADPTPALASLLSTGIVQQLTASPSRSGLETVVGT